MSDAGGQLVTGPKTESGFKGIFWTAVLSSAVLGAILTLVGTWFIESHKTNLLLRQERIQKENQNYENLESLLDDLSSQLGDLTVTANLALQSPKVGQLHASTLASLEEVTGSITKVIHASELHGVDPPIAKEIKDVISPLVQEIDRTQNNFENVRTICKSYDTTLKSQIESLRATIQQKVSDSGV